ncbi:protein of unknown function [Pararobbsia alpina]
MQNKSRLPEVPFTIAQGLTRRNDSNVYN